MCSHADDASQGKRPAVQSQSKGRTVIFQRIAEPNERAFTLLVPRG